MKAKPGGVWMAVGFVLTIMLFGFVFIMGLASGVIASLATAKDVETIIVEQTYREGTRTRDKIAIIPVEGIILDPSARFVRAAVEHVLSDGSVRAVILRVDSPGGAVTPSDQIWYQVQRLREAGYPVVASYGSLAASGGYYVSCAADHIVAEQTCITGSIGVIAQVFTIESMMDKVGIEPITIVATDSPEKDIANNPFREWRERDRENVLHRLDAAYDIFYERVKEGRSNVITDTTQLNRAADGSVFTADEALDLGLIDSIGYLDDAIVQAENMATLRPGRAKVVRLSRPPTLFGGGRVQFGPDGGLLDAESIRQFATELSSPRIMYLMR